MKPLSRVLCVVSFGNMVSLSEGAGINIPRKPASSNSITKYLFVDIYFSVSQITVITVKYFIRTFFVCF